MAASGPGRWSSLALFVGSHNAVSFSTVGWVLFSAWAFLSFFGRSLAGAPGMSSLEVQLRAVIPLAVASLGFGFLAGRRWRKPAMVALVPPVALGGMMLWGKAENGDLLPLGWGALPMGMASCVLLLGLLGSMVARLLFPEPSID